MKRSKSRSKSRSKTLFDNLEKNQKKTYNVVLGYSSSEKAKQTIRNVKKYSIGIQKQLINSMLNRAKYHKNQTDGMRDAIKIYKEWMKNN